MLDLAICGTTAFGIGYLFLLSPGMSTLRCWSLFIGLLVTPILIVLLKLSGLTNVVLVDRTLFALGLLGVTLAFAASHKKILENSTANPLLWALLAFVLGHVVFGLEYQVHHWDEYSYWMLAPKQMALFHELISEKFPIQFMKTYLPAIPIWHSFSEFVLASPFEESTAHVTNFLFGISLLPPIYKILRRSLPNPWLASSLAFACLFLASWGKIFEPSALIEPAFYIAMGGLFIIALEYERGNLKEQQFWFLTFLVLVGGYYIKQHFMLVVPGLALFVIYRLITQQDSKGLKSLLWLAITIVAFSSIALTWWLKASDMYEVKTMTLQIFFNDLTVGYNRYGGLYYIFKIVGRTLQHFTKDTLIHVLSFWGLYLYFKNSRTNRGFLIFALSFLTLLIGSMTYFYLVKFSAHEALNVTSIDRYLSYMSIPLRIVGVLFLIEYFLIPRLKTVQISPMAARTLFAAVYCICFTSTYWTRFPKEPPRHGEIAKLLEINPKNSGLLIAQGDNGLIRTVFEYISLENRELFLRFPREYSFYPSKRDEWTSVVTEDEMEKKIADSQFIWLHQGDDFIDAILKRHTTAECLGKNKPLLLIREKEQFHCIPL